MMDCDVLVTGISQLATPLGAGPKHGAEMGEVAVMEDAAIAVDGGRFVWVGRREDWRGEARETVDVDGRAAVPGLVDPHTHAVWAGDRLGDFDARTSGKTYEEILAGGGGIRSTVRATSSASVEELVALAVPRVEELVRSGATVVEVKSGYGFSVEGEIRSLEAIRKLALGYVVHPTHRDETALDGAPGILRLHPTSQKRDVGCPVWPRMLATLLVHVPPAERAERGSYVNRVVGELIPEAARRGLATAVDIFVEREAFTAAEARRVLGCAVEHGLKIKMHAEQFHAVGGVEVSLEMGALSVDHLEACSASKCKRFAESSTVATILPGVSLHLGIPAAPGRGLIDAGAAVAVGTDLNPGSSPLYSMAAALGLAVRMNGLTAKEALVAGTVNAAAALGLENAGRIEAGQPADFLVLEDRDWRSLVYTMGANSVREVWMGGVRAC